MSSLLVHLRKAMKHHLRAAKFHNQAAEQHEEAHAALLHHHDALMSDKPLPKAKPQNKRGFVKPIGKLTPTTKSRK